MRCINSTGAGHCQRSSALPRRRSCINARPAKTWDTAYTFRYWSTHVNGTLPCGQGGIEVNNASIVWSTSVLYAHKVCIAILCALLQRIQRLFSWSLTYVPSALWAGKGSEWRECVQRLQLSVHRTFPVQVSTSVQVSKTTRLRNAAVTLHS